MRPIPLIVLTLLISGNVCLAQSPSFVTDSLDSYIQRGMSQWQIPGLAIAIVKDGKVILEKGYGVREIGKQDNTIYTLVQVI